MKTASIVLFTLSTLCFFSRSAAQAPHTFFASPGLTIGYTFGAKVTYGARIDAGIMQRESKSHYKYGLSLSASWIHTKKHVHRMRTFGILGGNDFSQLVIGWGRVRNKWGYGKRNRCIVHGVMMDASFAAPDKRSPWVGIRTFQFPLAQWAWFDKPYNTVYTEYRYNTLENTRIYPDF